MLLTSGYLADFKTAYLQIATVEHRAEVVGGTDTNNGVTGYAVNRLVKVTRLTDGSITIAAPSGVSATSIGDATHIVAQADDSLDTTKIKGEQLNFAPIGILGNTAAVAATAITATMKRVALWKITNADDVKIIPVKPATVTVTR